jgi:integrase
LKTFRLRKKEHRPPDPFNIQEAEAIIARSYREFGEAHGHYEEFRFFTALRQSEQMALTIQDCDLINGKIRVIKAIVLAATRTIRRPARIGRSSCAAERSTC